MMPSAEAADPAISPGTRRALAYTSGVRRWICIITLLAGFTRQDYVWMGRSKPPVPTEQPYDRLPWRGIEVQPWDWWLVPKSGLRS
jgi:hypothetical protein